MLKDVLISNGSTGSGLVSVTRLVPCRTLCRRHIYGSSKTSHCDLLLVPALLFLPLQLILPSELCTHVAFPLTCRRGPHVAAAPTRPSSIIFGPPTHPRTFSRSCDGTLRLQSVRELLSGQTTLRKPPVRDCRNPGCKSEKVCPTSCRNKGTRPLPCSWETILLPANGTPWLAPTRLGAPQASLFRVQKCRPFKILTTRQQLSTSDRPNVASLRGRQHVRLGRQEAKQAGLPEDLYCMRYASLPCSFPSLCRVNTRLVACYCAMLTLETAHCRRRKIRCLLAEGDDQERCQNCIRLKKECVFYPVDQQQTLDDPSQPGSKSGPGSVPSSAVSQSPPELASGRPFERSQQYGSFPSLPSLPSNAPPGFNVPIVPGSTLPGQGDFMPGFPGHGLNDSDSTGVPHSEYAFQQTPTDSQRHWEQVNGLSSPNPSVHRARDSMQPQYWRSSPTAPSADFATFPRNSSAAASQISPQDASFPYHVPSAQNWPQSARSVSYGHIHDVGPGGYVHSPVGYAPQTQHESQTTSVSSYPAADGIHAHALPTVSGHSMAPSGQPMMSFGQPHSYMFQSHGPGSASPGLPQQQQYSNQWYGEAPHYGAPGHDPRFAADSRPFTTRP